MTLYPFSCFSATLSSSFVYHCTWLGYKLIHLPVVYHSQTLHFFTTAFLVYYSVIQRKFMKAVLLFLRHPPTVHFFMCRVWLLSGSLCTLGLHGNSAQVHEYCGTAHSSSLAHELFMNTYFVVGHGYYYIDICDSLWEKGALHSNQKNWVFYTNKKLQFISA